MPNLYNPSHKHYWEATGRRGTHAGTTLCEYVRCQTCGQNGFRIPPRQVIPEQSGPRVQNVLYTWSKDDLPEGITAD